MNQPLGILLRGTGSAIPSRVLSNSHFATFLDTSDEWIVSRTGIRERRIAGPDETSMSLGLEASRRALAAAQLPAADLDLIICATVTPVTVVPSNACRIQAALGAPRAVAFDLNAACTGFLYALSIADAMLRTNGRRHGLIVGTETLSRITDYTDRGSCILFGDGAGAAVLSASKEAGRGVRRVVLHADGTKGDLIHLGGFGGRPAWAGHVRADMVTADYLSLNGREVFRFAVQRVGQMVRDALDGCGLTPADVALVIPHQANQRIIDAAFADLGFGREKIMVNIDRCGNTSAASVPLALDEAIRTDRVRAGDTVLLLAFGGGMTWGSAVVTL